MDNEKSDIEAIVNAIDCLIKWRLGIATGAVKSPRAEQVIDRAKSDLLVAIWATLDHRESK